MNIKAIANRTQVRNVIRTLVSLGMSHQDIAVTFSRSVSTVKSWASGRTGPDDATLADMETTATLLGMKRDLAAGVPRATILKRYKIK